MCLRFQEVEHVDQREADLAVLDQKEADLAVLDQKEADLTILDLPCGQHSVNARANMVHQIAPVGGSNNPKERFEAKKILFGRPCEGLRNRPIPKNYLPNALVDVSNSPEGRLSPGGVAGKLGRSPGQYFGSLLKQQFVVAEDDSSPKIYQARCVPDTATDKENLSPFDPHVAARSTGDLEYDLSASVIEFEKLEGQMKKLRRRSKAIVAGSEPDGGATKRSIMRRLSLIKRKQEELLGQQMELQRQLNGQVSATIDDEGTSTGQLSYGDHRDGSCSRESDQTCSGGAINITELMMGVNLRSSEEGAVQTERSPPENSCCVTDSPATTLTMNDMESPVVIVTSIDAAESPVETTPPTIQQMTLLGVPTFTRCAGQSLLPFPQSPVRNSHYSPFAARFNGSDGSILFTPSTPGSPHVAEFYEQTALSPKSLMRGSAQILSSPIKQSIYLPLVFVSPSSAKRGHQEAPAVGRKSPVANLSRQLTNTSDGISSITSSPKIKCRSPLPRVAATSIGALSLAGNLASHHRNNPRQQEAKTSVRDRILGLAAHRYCEALLDEEVALFACRLHVTLGMAPLLLTRCNDPVASVLDDGDDQVRVRSLPQSIALFQEKMMLPPCGVKVKWRTHQLYCLIDIRALLLPSSMQSPQLVFCTAHLPLILSWTSDREIVPVLEVSLPTIFTFSPFGLFPI